MEHKNVKIRFPNATEYYNIIKINNPGWSNGNNEVLYISSVICRCRLQNVQQASFKTTFSDKKISLSRLCG